MGIRRMQGLQPTAFEQQVLREITTWKTRQPSPMGRAVAIANAGLQQVTGLAFRVPGLQWTIDNVFAGLLQLVNELAQDTVWQEGIYAAFHRQGYSVRSIEDIRDLELEAADRAMRSVDVKYRAVTAAQGVAAGVAGLAGIVPDVVGLVALNLRAVGEYATCCGFDMAQAHERTFALQILNAQASAAKMGDRRQRQEEGLVPLRHVSRAVADHHTRQTAQQVAVSASVKGLTRALGKRLTIIKLAQVVPMAGALIGGGTNALYTTRVCSAALHLYRERRLVERYPKRVLAKYRHAA